MKTNFKNTLLFIYIGRMYTAIVSFAFIPYIFDALGAEAYGLVGFFVVLQACLLVLEAGIGGVLTRQIILCSNNISSFLEFVTVYKRIIYLFLVVSFLIVFFVWLQADRINNVWLKSNLDDGVVVDSIVIMSIIIACRYMQGPLRSVLLGKEKHIFLTINGMVSITISAPIAAFVFYIGSGDVVTYFYIQLFAALLSLVVIWTCVRIELKRSIVSLENKVEGEKVCTTAVSLVKFAIQLSSLSLLWVLVTQSDKLVLTKVLMLKDFSYYSIAISLVGIIAIINQPVTQSLLPRLTRLNSASNYSEYTKIFEQSFSYLVAVLAPLSIFMFIDGEKLLFLWLGSSETAKEVQTYFPWLFSGAAVAVFSNLCYLLLYSHGKLRGHTLFYAVFSFIVIFLNIYIANKYLGTGTSIFYFINSIFLLVTWCLYNFISYFKGFVGYMLVKVLPIIVISLILLLVIPTYESEYPHLTFFVLAFKGLFVVLCNVSYLHLCSKLFQPHSMGTLFYSKSNSF